MDGLPTLLGLLLVAALAALVVWLWRRPARHAPRREAWETATGRVGRRIVLDLEVDDPDDAAVQRLVHDAAMRTLRDPAIDDVEVVDASGRTLGRERRPDPLREVTIPDQLHEPRVRQSRTPSVVPRPHVHPAAPARDADAADVQVEPLPLADRLALPAGVRARLREPDRAIDLVRAILEEAGRPVAVDGDLLVSDDVAVVFVDARRDPERALTHGFLRIQETSAARGLVLRLGHVDPRVVRRREAAAPHVRHVGVDALQRMADAVALGADPLAYAAGPVLR